MDTQEHQHRTISCPPGAEPASRRTLARVVIGNALFPLDWLQDQLPPITVDDHVRRPAQPPAPADGGLEDAAGAAPLVVPVAQWTSFPRAGASAPP